MIEIRLRLVRYSLYKSLLPQNTNDLKPKLQLRKPAPMKEVWELTKQGKGHFRSGNVFYKCDTVSFWVKMQSASTI